MKLAFASIALVALLGCRDQIAPDLTIGLDEVAGQSEPVRFTRRALANSFPGFEIAAEHYPVPHQMGREVFELRTGETVAFWADVGQEEIYTFSVFTNTPLVTGPHGLQVGLTKFGDVDAQVLGECGIGWNELSKHLVCLNGTFRTLFLSLDRTVVIGEPEMMPQDPNGLVLSEMRKYFRRPVQ